MRPNSQKRHFFDDNFPPQEQLPRVFDVCFKEVEKGSNKITIAIDNKQMGNLLTDNSYTNDGYRFHDVFHFSYVAILGWSPCVRKMLGKKRKSSAKVDEVEDGARAIITEEAISLILFNYAKEKSFFNNINYINQEILDTIVKLTSSFEVKACKSSEWEQAILQGYSAFNSLVKNNGGVIRVDMLNQSLVYIG